MRLLHPCPGARISQRYGENPGAYAAYGLPYHMGVDFACPVGTPIYAVADGFTENGDQGAAGFGRFVCLHMANGWHVYAGHLSKYASIGTRVKAGDVIGWSGNTGNSTGPHMHLEVRPDGTRLGAIDPLPLLEEGGMGSKLGLFYQTRPDWCKDIRVPWVKLIDPPEKNDWPWASVLGRTWIGGDATEQAMIWQGARGAEEYFARNLLTYATRPYVYAWMGPNEPHPMREPAFVTALNAFTVRWTELMHARGWRVMVGNFSVGWPDIGQGRALVPMMADADLLGLHEYSAPTMQSGAGSYCLRYRALMRELREAGGRVPPIVIGEAGIDGGVLNPPQARKGWVTFAKTWDVFRAQMEWYDAEVQKNPEVWCVTPFVAGPNSDWMDFVWNEQMCRWVASRHTTMERPVTNPVTMPVTNPVTNHEDAVRAVAWNALGVPYNPGAAFVKYAKANNMGRPLGPERGEGRYTVQAFERGIVYAVDADWGNVRHYSW